MGRGTEVAVGTTVGDDVGVGNGVFVGSGVLVGSGVSVGVGVLVGVTVGVGVSVGVGVEVNVGKRVNVAVAVGSLTASKSWDTRPVIPLVDGVAVIRRMGLGVGLAYSVPSKTSRGRSMVGVKVGSAVSDGDCAGAEFDSAIKPVVLEIGAEVSNPDVGFCAGSIF